MQGGIISLFRVAPSNTSDDRSYTGRISDRTDLTKSLAGSRMDFFKLDTNVLIS
jgi:hypothetical protein